MPPIVTSDQDIFSSSNLDHLMTVLAIILQPAHQREHFLRHFKRGITDIETDHTEDSSWIVVDSSGEDEEDATEMWHYFNENDIIQVSKYHKQASCINLMPASVFRFMSLGHLLGGDSPYLSLNFVLI